MTDPHEMLTNYGVRDPAFVLALAARLSVFIDTETGEFIFAARRVGEPEHEVRVHATLVEAIARAASL